VAITRATNTLRIFFDGVQQGSVTDTTNYNVTSILNIGYSSTYFNGYLDDVRITKGIARYTATFTPPVAALPFIPRDVDAAAIPVNSLNKSLRFRSSASAYLNRTFGTPTNNIKWTWSAWVKRGKLGSAGVMFQGYSSISNRTALQFNSSDQLFFNGSVATAITTAVFRDAATWYHIVCVYDSANATAANRLLLYVNGTVQTVTGTQPTASQVEYINGAWLHYTSTGYSGAFEYLDEGLAEINFIDGQALTPTAFGDVTTYDQWMPKAYTGTYGTNGFYLPFSNTTSTSTLVADSSGNANNWTANNISLTAGTTYDSFTDVPTRTSVTAGNYCTLNPLTYAGSSVVIRDGNLTFTKSGATYYNSTYGTIGVSSGKYYWEVTQGSTTDLVVGINNSFYSDANNGPGYSANSFIYMAYNGNKLNNYPVNGASVAYGAAFLTLNDVIGVALNMDAGTLTFYKNGVSQGVAFTGLSGKFFPYISDQGGQITLAYVNFGQRPFTYTAPSNFLALNTYNTSTIPMLFPAAPTIMPPAVETLVVAGGAGGGGWGGGGGAGGLIYDASYAVTSGSSYAITVGAGGIAGTTAYTDGGNGSYSRFGTMTAVGGGGAGHYAGFPGRFGGSGGGGGGNSTVTTQVGGYGIVGQGNAGGTSGGYDNSNYYGSGGGGGAGAVGTNHSGYTGGGGGIGIAYSISGITTYYAGGGGGHTPTAGYGIATGGLGGGGAGGCYYSTISAVAGTANTGGGGGGGYYGIGAGGSGIVIIRYLDSYLPASATQDPLYIQCPMGTASISSPVLAR